MSNVISKVKEWLTPILVVIIGYFAKNKMDIIDAKLDIINSLQGQVAVLQVKTDRNREDIAQNTLSILDLNKQFIDHLFKKEDEITIDKIIKPKK
jgi:hypothetical protein